MDKMYWENGESSMDEKYARCNYDGNPIHPTDLKAIESFKIWLQMDDTDRRLAIKLDPEWRKFVSGK